jgi:hypothetical protein
LFISEIHILPTSNTPEYYLNPEGVIKINGRGLIETKNEVSERIMSWIKEYLHNPAEITYVVIAFEYLNSSSTAILVSIIKEITKVVLKMKKFDIQWYYEEDDDDILERGEYISSAFNIPIGFIPVSDISVTTKQSFSEEDIS